MTEYEQAVAIVRQMTAGEKAKLLTGKDFWTTEDCKRLQLQSVLMTDGPHGLRKQIGNYSQVGLTQSYPSCCFPPACCSACSFDETLLYRMGEALAEECLEADVSLLLGPGINHKRSPLAGRNFEYFSEDPLLTGTLAAAYVNGVQSKGIGTSLKHFAANSQEKCRLINDSVIDERTLHEIYLKAFEIVVKKAQPYSIMTAYNQLNGTYCSENKQLMTDICRKQWGFEGFFVSDWGAMSDPLNSYLAGLDLEMPGISKGSDKIVLEAIENKKMSPTLLDDIAIRLVKHLIHYQRIRPSSFLCDRTQHLQLARQIAEESYVLLKNDGTLPLSKEQKILIVGDLSIHPRYQGAGSSLINPYDLDCPYDYFVQEKYQIDYASGYRKNQNQPDFSLIEEAVKKAEMADVILLFIGLNESSESEGYDRENLDLPASHVKLYQQLLSCHKKIVLVLQGGGVMLFPSSDACNAMLMTYLGGSKNGEATFNVLTGKVNPSGRLAETFPQSLSSVPCHEFFEKNDYVSLYKEGIFTGYRYYDSASVPVLFPFGFGLSYTEFAYLSFEISKDKMTESDSLQVRVTLQNIGERPGKEVIQLYIGKKESKVFRAKKELKAFQKVFLKEKEKKTVDFCLTKEAFSFYNVSIHDFCVESGTYQIYLCKNVSDIIEMKEVYISGHADSLIQDRHEELKSYYEPSRIPQVGDEEFSALLQRSLPSSKSIRPYSINTRLKDIKKTSLLGNLIISVMAKKVLSTLPLTGEKETIQQMLDACLYDMPLRSAGMGAPYSKENIQGFVDIFNGHYIRGLKKIKLRR